MCVRGVGLTGYGCGGIELSMLSNGGGKEGRHECGGGMGVRCMCGGSRVVRRVCRGDREVERVCEGVGFTSHRFGGTRLTRLGFGSFSVGLGRAWLLGKAWRCLVAAGQ